MSKKKRTFAPKKSTLKNQKVMAKINSVAIGKAKGSIGNVTYKVTKGETIASQKVSKGTQKIGTYRQVARRILLSNIVTAYQRLNAIGDGRGMHHSFPLRPTGNDFNGFTAENLNKPSVAAVCTPKGIGNILIPAPFVVSRGSLAAPTELQATFSDGAYSLGSGTYADMGDVSAKLISDFGFRQGDTVTIFSMSWGQSAQQSAIIRGYQFHVDSDSSDPLPSFISTEGAITVAPAGNSDAVIVRGRKDDNGYNVSDAEFSDACMSSAAYIAYTGATAQLNAIDSWGFKSEPYLQANPQ